MDYPFSEQVKRILQRANDEALRLDCEYVGTDHVLLALLRDGNSPAARILVRLGLQLETVQREVDSSVPPVRSPVRVGRPPRTPRVMHALEHAFQICRKPGHPRSIGPEHLLLGLLADEEGLAAQVLLGLGLPLRDVRAAVLAEWGLPSGITTAPASPAAAAKPSEEKVHRAEEVDLLQDAPPAAASMSLHLPAVERSIVHHGWLARVLSFLYRLRVLEPPALDEEESLPPPVDLEPPSHDQEESLPPPEAPAASGPSALPTPFSSSVPATVPETAASWGPNALDGFTDRARKVMQLANQEAHRLNHEYIGTEHILLGLVKEEGVAAGVLMNLNISMRTIRRELDQIVQPGPPDVLTLGKLPPTPRLKKILEYAIEEARQLNLYHIGTEHLLMGLLRDQEGVASQVLMNLGVTLEMARDEARRLLS